jgi:hypothetical protein
VLCTELVFTTFCFFAGGIKGIIELPIVANEGFGIVDAEDEVDDDDDE